MSMYNMLHGVNPLAGLLLQALKLDARDVQRIRDVCLTKKGDGLFIKIIARTGGGNREYYPNAALTIHKNYVTDEDDDFDNTYANYFFKIPDDLMEVLKELSGDDLEVILDNKSMKEKTQEAIEALKNAKS